MEKWIFTFQFAHIAKNSECKRSEMTKYLQIKIRKHYGKKRLLRNPWIEKRGE